MVTADHSGTKRRGCCFDGGWCGWLLTGIPSFSSYLFNAVPGVTHSGDDPDGREGGVNEHVDVDILALDREVGSQRGPGIVELLSRAKVGRNDCRFHCFHPLS